MTKTAPAPAPKLEDVVAQAKVLGYVLEEDDEAHLEEPTTKRQFFALADRVNELEDGRRRARIAGLLVLGLVGIVVLNWLEARRRPILRPAPPAPPAEPAPAPAPVA